VIYRNRISNSCNQRQAALKLGFEESQLIDESGNPQPKTMPINPKIQSGGSTLMKSMKNNRHIEKNISALDSDISTVDRCRKIN
jgi:hypothetical protein